MHTLTAYLTAKFARRNRHSLTCYKSKRSDESVIEKKSILFNRVLISNCLVRWHCSHENNWNKRHLFQYTLNFMQENSRVHTINFSATTLVEEFGKQLITRGVQIFRFAYVLVKFVGALNEFL